MWKIFLENQLKPWEINRCSTLSKIIPKIFLVRFNESLRKNRVQCRVEGVFFDSSSLPTEELKCFLNGLEVLLEVLLEFLVHLYFPIVALYDITKRVMNTK
jgi:hypothetical protein